MLEVSGIACMGLHGTFALRAHQAEFPVRNSNSGRFDHRFEREGEFNIY
jgi:hypothetical protein